MRRRACALAIVTLIGRGSTQVVDQGELVTEDLEDNDPDVHKMFLRMLPSRHVRIGRVALETMMDAIKESVDKSVDDFWKYHQLFPYQEGINLPTFPRVDFFEARGVPDKHPEQKADQGARFAQVVEEPSRVERAFQNLLRVLRLDSDELTEEENTFRLESFVPSATTESRDT